MLTPKEWNQINKMSRQEMITKICDSGYIFPLEQQGRYLFGKTKNDRAVCLIWRDENNGQAKMEHARSMFEEIRIAGLKVPFLLFGATCLFSTQSVEFLQIPTIWEEDRIILRTIQGMNMRTRMHLVNTPAKAG